MVYPIVKFPAPILTTPAQPVRDFGTPDLRRLVDDMFESMYAHGGVGLAAPQIGLGQQLTVVDVSAGDDPAARLALLNPSITARAGRQTDEEGCLSIPGFRADVTRALRVTVRAQDIEGAWFETSGEQLLARALQHEIDHLRGVLFLAHLSTLKRDLIKRKIKKMQRAGEW